MSNDPTTDVNLDNKKAPENILYLQECCTKYEETIRLLQKENYNLKKNHGELAHYVKNLKSSSSDELKNKYDSLSIQKQQIEKQLEEEKNNVKKLESNLRRELNYKPTLETATNFRLNEDKN